MSIKVFQTNANGKIEFTRCELEKLLNETYDEGYRAGENQAKGQYWTWAPNWMTLTSDSTNNRITTTTTNAIDDLKCAATNTTNTTNAIDDLRSAATENLDNNCAKATIETKATPTNHNGAKAAITTCTNNESPRTYTIDLGKNFDFDSMAKLIEEVLYGHPKQSACGEQTDPFTSLAKELSGV